MHTKSLSLAVLVALPSAAGCVRSGPGSASPDGRRAQPAPAPREQAPAPREEAPAPPSEQASQPAAGDCGVDTLTAGVGSPAHYWSFASGASPSVGSAEMTTSGSVSFTGGVAELGGKDGTFEATGIDKTENFTVALRVRPADASGKQMLVNLGNGPGSWQGWGIQLQEDDSLVFFAEGGGGAGEEISVTSEPLPAGAWTHIVAVKQGPTMKLFVGGELAGESSEFPGDINYGDEGLVFGRHSYFDKRYFNGALDDVLLWTEALDGARAAKLEQNRC